MSAPTLADAVQADAADPLAHFRDRFVEHGDDVVAYLDGNSLGRPPKSTSAAMTDMLQQWGTGLIRNWSDGWMDLPAQVGNRIGEVALGAAPGQVIVADSTTVCLYKLLRGAVAMRPGRNEIVCDVHNFPTDRYVVEGVAAECGLTVRWIETDTDAGVTAEQLARVLSEHTAVVTLSHVAYRSAFIADMATITALARDAGALTVWDLCHSVGSVPVELDELGVDFAVGCTYKFLCGGPGAPAFAYVATRHQEAFVQPIWGWLGRLSPFAMEQGYQPVQGISRVLSGTPPILGIVGVSEGIELVAEAGITAIREKAIGLTEMTIALADAWLGPLGMTLDSPRDPARRGAHVTIRRADAGALSERLIKRGVLIDFRTPDGIRVGLSPLSTSFSELWKAMEIVAEECA